MRRPGGLTRGVALALLVATGCLVLLGSTVRVTESGMGCSSWPLCNGAIGPIDHLHPLLEQTHRYLAALVSVGVGAVFVLSRRSDSAALRRWAAVALGIIGVQIALGAITVLTHNAPATVAAHLVVGLVLLATTALIAAASFGLGGRPLRGVLGATSVVVTLLLLVSGSIVVDGGASGACPSWPWCGPRAGVPWRVVDLQLVHRATAATAVVLLVVLALRRRRRTRSGRTPRRLASLLIALLAAQVATGALDTLLRAPDALQDVHLGFAGAIWCLAVVLVLAPERERPPDIDIRAPGAVSGAAALAHGGEVRTPASEAGAR